MNATTSGSTLGETACDHLHAAMMRSRCPECDAGLEPGDQTCQSCGAPLSFAPGQDGVGCRVCGAVIGAYAETCPRCGENGYPALRPRKGTGFEGAPDEEAGA